MTSTTIYRARRILTMNPSQPEATHVAVRDGRILGAGPLEDLAAWGSYTLDERFADKVLLPGFVEGHSHLMAGSLWRYVYCGYFDVRDPGGRLVQGSPSLEAVVQALADSPAAKAPLSDAAAKAPLSDAAATAPAGSRAPGPAVGSVVGWGLDPIYFGARRCAREDLDRVATDRPVAVLHASGHILNVNTEALRRAGLLRQGVDHPGIPLGDDGLPTGELKGPEAMLPVFDFVGMSRSFLSGDEFGIRAFGKLAVRAGVTTATDLAATATDNEIAQWLRITGEADYPLRLVPYLRLIGISPAEAVARARTIGAHSTEQLRLGRIKVVADGSIQGYSARLRWPHYIGREGNGLWYTAPQTVREVFTLGLKEGVLIHTHTNGDEATEMVLDMMEAALKASPALDHRYTLQHCQLADAAQFRRMKALGMGVNLFANHHFYWGDQHRSVTVGPERAERMNACRSALDEGVPFAVHSDAPVTPLNPMFTVWCAVNRLTASGRVLGAHQRIGVMDALRAVTLGAAWTLKLDGEVGSIECGKRADFAVLEDDPTTVEPAALKDLRVWGTVQGGRVFQAG